MISNRIAARITGPVTAAVDRMESRLLAKIEAACKPEPVITPDLDAIERRVRSIESNLTDLASTADNTHSLVDDIDDRTRDLSHTLDHLDLDVDTDDLENEVSRLDSRVEEMHEEIKRLSTALEDLRDAVRNGSAVTFKVEVVRDRSASSLPVAAL